MECAWQSVVLVQLAKPGSGVGERGYDILSSRMAATVAVLHSARGGAGYGRRRTSGFRVPSLPKLHGRGPLVTTRLCDTVSWMDLSNLGGVPVQPHLLRGRKGRVGPGAMLERRVILP